jgi:UDP-N-acetyl-D-mannosaminuronic acid transferase (WecB/TagA/CpsF family)
MVERCITQETCNTLAEVLVDRVYGIDMRIELMKGHAFTQKSIDELGDEKERINNALEDLQRCKC